MTTATHAIVINRHGRRTRLCLTRPLHRRLFNRWCGAHSHRLDRVGATLYAREN